MAYKDKVALAMSHVDAASECAKSAAEMANNNTQKCEDANAFSLACLANLLTGVVVLLAAQAEKEGAI